MPKIIVQMQGREWAADLVPGSNTVGRSSQCTVPIREASLSRQHCEIVLKPDGVATLVDKGSMNGTLLNGKRVWEQALTPGDRITIGQVTLWYEVKKTAPAAAPAPVAASTRRGDSSASAVATRRSVTASQEPPPAPAPAPGAVQGLPEDYVVNVGGGAATGKILIAVAAVIVLGAAAWFGKGLLAGGGTVGPRDNNLFRYNPGFNTTSSGRVDGWRLQTGRATKASIDGQSGVGGTPCVLLEKSSQPSDRVVELAYGTEFPAKGSAVEAQVEARFEAFSGAAAVRIDWLRRARGPVVLSEVGPLARDAADWTTIGARFEPPPGAGAFRLSLLAAGGGGRVYFDDVKAVLAAADAEAPRAIGAHKLFSTPQGVSQLHLRGSRTIDGIAATLEGAEGAVSQALASADRTVQEGRVLFSGRLPHPADLSEVAFDLMAAEQSGGTSLTWSFPADALQGIDVVAVSLSLPRCEAMLGMSDDPGTRRVTAVTGGGDVAVEFPVEPARTTSSEVNGRTVLRAAFAADPSGDVLNVTVVVRDGEEARPKEPKDEARTLEKRERYGEALALYRTLAAEQTEPKLRAPLDQKVKELTALERREWADLVGAHIRTSLTRDPTAMAEARRLLDQYRRHWGAVAENERKAAALVGAADKERASLPDPDREVPARLLARARAEAAAGRRSIAVSMLTYIQGRWPGSDPAKEADKLKRSLEE